MIIGIIPKRQRHSHFLLRITRNHAWSADQGAEKLGTGWVVSGVLENAERSCGAQGKAVRGGGKSSEGANQVPVRLAGFWLGGGGCAELNRVVNQANRRKGRASSGAAPEEAYPLPCPFQAAPDPCGCWLRRDQQPKRKEPVSSSKSRGHPALSQRKNSVLLFLMFGHSCFDLGNVSDRVFVTLLCGFVVIHQRLRLVLINSPAVFVHKTKI